jgi:hypothetical protein
VVIRKVRRWSKPRDDAPPTDEELASTSRDEYDDKLDAELRDLDKDDGDA